MKRSFPSALYLGHGKFYGRYLGLGVTEPTEADNKHPHQFFRMDWHQPYGHQDFIDGRFHFHTCAKR